MPALDTERKLEAAPARARSGWSRLARHVAVIAWKDLRAEMRTKEAINASFAFALVILLLFSFAFDPTEEQTQCHVRRAAVDRLRLRRHPGAEPQLRAGTAQRLPGCADGRARLGRRAVSGQGAREFRAAGGHGAVSLPVFGIFYNVRWTAQFWPLVGVLALGTWGLTVIGTIFSALTVNIRLREVMLPLLVYPILIPALMAAMQLSTVLIAGKPLSPDDMVWVRLLVGFDVMFTALSIILMETVLVG